MRRILPWVLLLAAACDDAENNPPVPDAGAVSSPDLSSSDPSTPDLSSSPPADLSTVNPPVIDLSTAVDSSPPGCVYDETSDGTAKVLGIYTMPAMSLAIMNPFLTQQQLLDGVTNGAATTDAPGPGSGLEYGGGCPGTFYMVGDRGPNLDRTSGTKSFPIPAYTPAMLKVHLTPANELLVDATLPFVNRNGAPVTGLPNLPTDEVAYVSAASTTALADNQDGLDPEDLRRLPNGDFAICEEYSPSVAIVDGATGKIKVRYTPAGITLPSAQYLVKPILPAVLSNRRSNKGLEGLALSPDGKTAYAVLQAPMGEGKAYDDGLVNRIVRIDHFDEPQLATTGGEYLVLHRDLKAFPGTNKQSKIYYNSATWLSPDHLLLLERGDAKLKLVVVDLSAATNLLGLASEPTLDPESKNVGWQALSLVPAPTTEVFDSDDTPTFITNPPGGAIPSDKLEGVAVINRTTVAITNDNDFAVQKATDRTRIWVLRLKAPLPN
jgi:hypothetical protein